MLIYKHLYTQDIHNRYKNLIIKYIRNKSCFLYSDIFLAKSLTNCNAITTFITVDVHTAALHVHCITANQ